MGFVIADECIIPKKNMSATLITAVGGSCGTIVRVITLGGMFPKPSIETLPSIMGQRAHISYAEELRHELAKPWRIEDAIT